LERALTLGEFRLVPASSYQGLEDDAARQDDELCRIRTVAASEVVITGEDGRVIKPLADVTFTSRLSRDYYVVCFSTEWSPDDCGGFSDVDACLVIHDPETLLERLHAEIERVLPGCANADGPVSYGTMTRLGVAYTKPAFYAPQREFRLTVFAPEEGRLAPLLIKVGNIEDIAKVVLLPVETER
jgi:hypothetical protein